MKKVAETPVNAVSVIEESGRNPGECGFEDLPPPAATAASRSDMESCELETGVPDCLGEPRHRSRLGLPAKGLAPTPPPAAPESVEVVEIR